MNGNGLIMAIVVIAVSVFNPFIGLALAAAAGAYYGFSHNRSAANKMLVISCLILIWLFAGSVTSISGGSS